MNMNLLQGRANVTSVVMISSASLLQEGSGASGMARLELRIRLGRLAKWLRWAAAEITTGCEGEPGAGPGLLTSLLHAIV